MPKKKPMGDNPLADLGKVPAKGVTPWDAAHPPAAYRLPRELSERVKEIANQEGVPAYQVVAYILGEWVKRYDRGEASLPVQERAETKKVVEI